MTVVLETTFTWTINDFDMCPLLPGEALESPAFSVDAMKTTKFSLLAYRRGATKETFSFLSFLNYGQAWKWRGEKFKSVFLKRHDDDAEDEINLSVEMSFASAADDKDLKFKRFQTLLHKNESCGSLICCERDFQTGRYLSDKRLTVRCHIEGQYQNKDGDSNTNSFEDYISLSNDFGQLLESENHSDMTIVADGREFKVHAAILDNRCPYLVKQLVKMIDSTTTYSLPSVEASKLHKILKYIYTGVFPCDEMFGMKLTAANNYPQSELEKIFLPCSGHLEAITDLNVFQKECLFTVESILGWGLSVDPLMYHLHSENAPEWSRLSIYFSKDYDNNIYVHFERVRNEIILLNSEFQVEFPVRESIKEWRIVKNEYMFVKDGAKEKLHIKEIAQGMPVLPHERYPLRLKANIRVSIANSCFFKTTKFDFNRCREWVRFGKHFRNIYVEMKDPDLFLCLGGVKLAAHKAILCSRSEVFLKMFEHDMTEKRTGSVTIEDADALSMVAVLSYMYYGSTNGPLDMANAFSIYSVAEKYQILNLKEKCSSYLQTHITVENVGKMLIFAYHYADQKLNDAVQIFIEKNTNEILKANEGLKVLQNRKDVLCMLRDELRLLLTKLFFT